MTGRAVVVICARDEATRIGAVLDAVRARGAPALVVDDGSSDGTADVARRRGFPVLSLPRNVGKGRAMRIGADASAALLPSAPRPEDAVLFLDADLVGIRPEHLDRVAAPVVSGGYAMVAGLRDYGEALNPAVARLPVITGERAVRRDVLAILPDRAWQGYGVETWINHAAHQAGPVGLTVLDGVSVVPRWEKEGPGGAHDLVRMGIEVVDAHFHAANFRNSQSRQLPVVGPRSGSEFQGLTTDYRRPTTAGTYASAPTPASLRAGTSREEVTRELARQLVEAGGPFVRDHLWTEEARRHVGEELGRQVALPLWAVGCAACAAAFGPAAGAAVAVGGILHSLTRERRQRVRR